MDDWLQPVVELVFCLMGRAGDGGVDADDVDRPVCCVET